MKPLLFALLLLSGPALRAETPPLLFADAGELEAMRGGARAEKLLKEADALLAKPLPPPVTEKTALPAALLPILKMAARHFPEAGYDRTIRAIAKAKPSKGG